MLPRNTCPGTTLQTNPSRAMKPPRAAACRLRTAHPRQPAPSRSLLARSSSFKPPALIHLFQPLLLTSLLTPSSCHILFQPRRQRSRPRSVRRLQGSPSLSRFQRRPPWACGSPPPGLCLHGRALCDPLAAFLPTQVRDHLSRPHLANNSLGARRISIWSSIEPLSCAGPIYLDPIARCVLSPAHIHRGISPCHVPRSAFALLFQQHARLHHVSQRRFVC